jgi:hypothetical protein
VTSTPPTPSSQTETTSSSPSTSIVVGQRLGHDEVRGRLDRGRQAALDPHVNVDRQGRALGQRADRGGQPAAGEDRRLE